MSERFHIVFVCTGNICRSPMAEAMVRDALDSAGLGDRVEVESAGTGGWHAGDGMDPRAAAELESLGIDAEHSAQQIDDRLLGADLLVALDSGHERALRHAGADPERIRMLRSFDSDAHGLDVADPYYGSALDFRTVRHQIAAAAPGIVEFVREQTS